jgi:hypothetical protein
VVLLATLVLGAVAVPPLQGQAPPASNPSSPAFDIADVHLHPLTRNPSPNMSGGVLRGGRYDLRNVTMLDLIEIACEVDRDTILGGPSC